MSEISDVIVEQIENVGGFFGGDTITLTVRHQDQTQQTITIDEHAFSNVASRFNITSGMLLRISHTGARIESAELLGAHTADQLRNALGTSDIPAHLDQAHILSYWCKHCQLWLQGTPQQHCQICQQAL